MAIERTLSILKPSAVRDNHIGAILAKFEAAGLRIVAAKMIRMSREQAEAFYGVHRDKPFFGELVEAMTSGPVLVQVLEGADAIRMNRDVMGATNPADAAPGTIRAEFATSITENAVHGSDAPETAAEEIRFFFDDRDIHSER
jgi:nucleoside-diphosphate kinase